MNIAREKEHIYSMMRDIGDERRKLTEIYYGLKERLDALNQIEMRGLSDLDLKGYVDLYNQTNREVSVANIERESRHLIQNITNEVRHTVQDTIREENRHSEDKQKYLGEKDLPQPRRDVEESGSSQRSKEDQIAEKWATAQAPFKERMNKQAEEEREKREEEKRRFEKNVENSSKRTINRVIEESEPKDEESVAMKEQKHIDLKRRTKKARQPKFKIDEVINVIVGILKEAGKPLSMSEIHEEVQAHYKQEISIDNFRNNLMFRANKMSPKIDRAMRGYYQYKF